MKLSYAVVIGGAIFIFFAVVMVAVFIPGWIWNPPQTIAAHVYTERQLRGRTVYFSNGCDYCHTQYVRYYDADRTGPVSQGGNYVFDRPLTLGSERTGPDLSYIGRKRDMAWEIEHLKFPRKYSPMSIMPDWYFLPQSDLEAVADYLFSLGDRVTAEWMIQPPVDYAHDQNPITIPQSTPDPTGADQGWPTWSQSKLQDGKIIYIDRCQTCHGCAGNGLGNYAGTKVVTPADFKVEPFNTMPDDQWFWHVSEGIQGTVMPPWRESLTEDERWMVIRYVQQEFAHPTERDPAEGDPVKPYAGMNNPLPQTVATLNEGKTIYTRECMVCHGDAGAGEGPYGTFLRPQPANFTDHGHYGTIANPQFTDADYYWRISEGLPWSAMPVWKVKFTDEQRWALVYYIRVSLSITLPRPAVTGPQTYPSDYTSQHKPSDLTADQVDVGDNDQLVYRAPDPEIGKSVFTLRCAECHGSDGLGNGWNAQFLDVKPANFTTPDVRGLSDGDWFARVSLGLQNSAMPVWGEWLPEQDRWDAIDFVQKYVLTAKAQGQATIMPSNFTKNGGAVSNIFLTLSQSDWTDEGGVLDPTHGGDLYNQYCAVCHAPDGKGFTASNAPAGLNYPSALPDGMSQAYVYQVIWEGIPNTLMPDFKLLLEPADVWDLVVHIVGIQQGG